MFHCIFIKDPPVCLGEANSVIKCNDREFAFGVACSLEGINRLIRPYFFTFLTEYLTYIFHTHHF